MLNKESLPSTTLPGVSKILLASSKDLRLSPLEPTFRHVETMFIQVWIEELAATVLFETDLRVGILDCIEPCPIFDLALLGSRCILVVFRVGFIHISIPLDP